MTAPARRLTVTGGEALRLEFRLQSDTSGERSGPKVASSVIGPRGTRVWIAYGAAAVLGASAATFALLARNANRVVDDDLGRFPGDRAGIDQDRGHLRTWAGLTDGFAAATVIAAGVGTYFLFASRSEGESPPLHQSVAQVAVLPSGVALSLSGSY